MWKIIFSVRKSPEENYTFGKTMLRNIWQSVRTRVDYSLNDSSRTDCDHCWRENSNFIDGKNNCDNNDSRTIIIVFRCTSTLFNIRPTQTSRGFFCFFTRTNAIRLIRFHGHTFVNFKSPKQRHDRSNLENISREIWRSTAPLNTGNNNTIMTCTDKQNNSQTTADDRSASVTRDTG